MLLSNVHSGYRLAGIPEPRADLTRAEVDAIGIQRKLAARLREMAAELRGMKVASDLLPVTWLTDPTDIATELADYARAVDHDIADIDAGRAQEEC